MSLSPLSSLPPSLVVWPHVTAQPGSVARRPRKVEKHSGAGGGGGGTGGDRALLGNVHKLVYETCSASTFPSVLSSH